MTVEEFFDWCPNDDSRWELIDGRPVAMAPAGGAHQVLWGNLAYRFAQALDSRRNCSVRIGGGILPPERADSYYEADLAVSCTPPDRGDRGAVKDPVLIAEILSPSTEGTDRRRKLPDYRSIPGVREILLIAQDGHYAEVHRRLDGDRWLTDLVRGPEARLRLESIGLDVALADIYAGVPLDEAESA
jgi:Uma2 family endonuclease